MTIANIERPAAAGTASPQAPRSPEVAAGPAAPDRWRLRRAMVCLLLIAFAFNSDAGKVAPDTKLDLAVNPAAFLARALHLWDPQGFSGQVQNQAYGYLFPMGPFFLLGHAAHFPAWIVQRLWWSLLLCVAFLGVSTLCRRLGVGSPFSQLLAGVAFAASPHLLSVLGPLSAEALPMCLTPWVLVPLVGKHGSPRRAGLLSALAVLCMGAVNAALVVAALVPVLTWFACQRPDRRLRRLLGWWVLGVALATAWWVLPLLLLGRYSSPFLDYIESAATTTSVTSLVESLRGTADWVGYLPSSGWHAGWLLLTEPAIILNSVVVVALGLAGLAGRRMPARSWLVVTLLVGVCCLTFGYRGQLSGLSGLDGRRLLDGALAPLRNVHKFDVAIRLPLVLGLAQLVGRLRWGRTGTERRFNRLLVLAVAAVAVVGTATPLIALRLAPAGTFASVPDYWRQAAGWLTERHDTGRALVVPGSRFGQYVWGTPMDEPLQPLAGSDWDVRNAIPLTDTGHIRLLDALDDQFAAGQPTAGLAPVLARSGIRYLVVRNDLDYGQAQSTRPVLVHQVLAGSPGLSLTQSFGPPVGGGGNFAVTLDANLQLPYHAVEIWSVDGSGEDRVALAPQSDTIGVSGGPESLLALSADGLLADQPTVLAGEEQPGYRPGSTILTDGSRRREANFGAPSVNTSATLAVDDPRRMANPHRDYQLVPDAEASYAQLAGAKSVQASTSGSDPNAFNGSVHSEQPYSAFDGDATTSWRSNAATAGVGQWLQIDFGASRQLDSATILLPTDSHIAAVSVRTDRGSISTRLSGPGSRPLSVPAGPSRSLRVTVTAVTDPGLPFQQVAIAELTIPGLRVERSIVVPPAPAGSTLSAIDFSVPTDARNGCVLVGDRPLCVPGFGRAGEEGTALDRTFDTPTGQRFGLAASAVPRAGPALDALLAAAGPSPVGISTSSRAMPDPLAGPDTIMDGDLGTGWIADPADRTPTVTISLPKRARLSAMTLIVDPFLAATAPDSVLVTSRQGNRAAKIGPNGAIDFAPLVTDQFTVRLSSSYGLRSNYDPVAHSFSKLGVGISELSIDGIPSSKRADTDRIPVTLPCASTPDLVLDGVSWHTQGITSVGALRELAPVALRTCGRSGTLSLAAGRHRLRAAATPAWSVTGVLLRAPTGTPVAGPASAEVLGWGAEQRAVRLGARSTASVLVVHENANAGWQASLGGSRLRRITVDGWEQGYLLPAGAAGVVRLHYAPDRGYKAALVLGAFAVLLLLALCVLPLRRRWSAASPAPAGLPPVATASTSRLAIVGLLAMVIFGGWPGLLTGVTVLAACFAMWRLTPRAAPLLVPAAAAVSYLAAGVLLALHHWNTDDYLADGFAIQLLCVVALGFTALGAVAAPAESGAEPAPDAASPSRAVRSPDS